MLEVEDCQLVDNLLIFVLSTFTSWGEHWRQSVCFMEGQNDVSTFGFYSNSSNLNTSCLLTSAHQQWLQWLYNWGVRIATSLQRFDHVSHHRHIFNWLSIPSLLKYCSLCAMQQICHLENDTSLHPPIVFGSIHDYHTRLSSRRIRPLCCHPEIISAHHCSLVEWLAGWDGYCFLLLWLFLWPYLCNDVYFMQLLLFVWITQLLYVTCHFVSLTCVWFISVNSKVLMVGNHGHYWDPLRRPRCTIIHSI